MNDTSIIYLASVFKCITCSLINILTGVCAEGYAATSNNECEDCTGRESYYYVIFIFFCSTFALCIFVFLWFSVKDTVDPAVKVDSEKSISTDSCPIASSQSTCDEMINDTSRSTTSGTGKTASIYTLKPIRYIAKLNVAEMANKIDLQTFTTNSITTFKLLLSFYLIMTQVVSSIALFCIYVFITSCTFPLFDTGI